MSSSFACFRIPPPGKPGIPRGTLYYGYYAAISGEFYKEMLNSGHSQIFFVITAMRYYKNVLLSRSLNSVLKSTLAGFHSFLSP
ncbi:MAG: hypothetical protein JXB88_15485 [Spirochaetales bacterium]|nr:hypothetical protein [Spirochaetales bacterium]